MKADNDNRTPSQENNNPEVVGQNILPKSLSNIIALPNKSTFLMYIQTTPLFIRFIFLSSILFYTLSFFFPNFVLGLCNVPIKTFTNFRLWSVFTSFLVTLQWQNLLYALLIWVPEGRTLERTLGTLKYVSNFMINTVIIQIMFLIITLILSIFISSITDVPSCGIVPAMFAEITILSLANPNNVVTFLHIPLHFRAIYYPFIVLLLFVVINLFKIYVDALCGLGYGFLFFYCFRPYLVISDEFIARVSNLIPVKYFKFIPGFIELPNNKISYSSFKQNNSVVSITIPQSPSKIATLNLNNSTNSSRFDKPQVSVERLDISQDNRNELKTNDVIKYHNVENKK